jgi:hypothetical protein
METGFGTRISSQLHSFARPSTYTAETTPSHSLQDVADVKNGVPAARKGCCAHLSRSAFVASDYSCAQEGCFTEGARRDPSRSAPLQFTPEERGTRLSSNQMTRAPARLFLPNAARPPSRLTAETTRSRSAQDVAREYRAGLAKVKMELFTDSALHSHALAPAAGAGEAPSSEMMGTTTTEKAMPPPWPMAPYNTVQEEHDSAQRRMAESRMKLLASRLHSTSRSPLKARAGAADADPAPIKTSHIDVVAKMSLLHKRMTVLNKPAQTRALDLTKVTSTKAGPVDNDFSSEVTTPRNIGGGVKEAVSEARHSLLEKNIDEFECASSRSSPNVRRVVVKRLASPRQSDKADGPLSYSLPVRACGSYKSMPAYIQNKRAVLNIMNSDEKSFLWCILAARHPVAGGRSPHRVTNYEWREKEVTGLTFPTPLSQIPLFELLNEVSVNVLAYLGDRQIVPVFITTRRYPLHVNLLLVSDEAGRHHFCLVRSMSRLLRDGLLNKGPRAHHCNYCFEPLPSQVALTKHVGICSGSSRMQERAKLRRTELAADDHAAAVSAAAAALEDARAGRASLRRRKRVKPQTRHLLT